jgi:hypothetical protein
MKVLDSNSKVVRDPGDVRVLTTCRSVGGELVGDFSESIRY